MTSTVYLQVPIGIIKVTASHEALKSIVFVNKAKESNANRITDIACQQLEEYFAGKRQEFDLPLDKQGTEFQESVWLALQEIPYAETYSYQQIAEKIKRPKAMRAVGSANGKNPLAIVVPCHRVIASDGSLSGYEYGVDKKSWLLQLEQENKQEH